ncbi:glyoxylase-like metal-dependent hydrolase (beta-lactamase superfamily II) [Antricoccus suffuscus]|uniref:Glyoxylase-like metal-dependent hydrolase (Beta-lactamase superfamily II) n=1 Tax=Antricoccus suffuscus TaxID=1629062 RepID=A0A2T1A5Y4_9ACTN|nr:MBL fold metallo-hydrolase [Antricoccus suffuscus]PRZ43999.1 glyoxylase-like metal-dependent hydrolase (beta-lactamase superfamily II) [Antricoccus suffuscus]
MAIDAIPYTKGSHRLTERCHAWLVPDGTWGWSNAGLVTGHGQSLLVDTLFDLPMTREMLAGLRPITDEAPIRTVVNTHANGDHWFGNELVADAEIIASKSTAEEMAANGPDLILGLFEQPGATGRFARHAMGQFEFKGITPTPATRTFEKELQLDVGGTEVRVYELGPAHTAGDSVVVVPAEKTLYAGDLLFIGGTPISWAGPVSNWVAACKFMLDLDVDFIVPGHGPVTDKGGVQDVMDYLVFVEKEATARHDAGMSPEDAMRDINLGRFDQLDERGRLAQNVLAVYYELDPSLERQDTLEVFRRIAELEGFTD